MFISFTKLRGFWFSASVILVSLALMAGLTMPVSAQPGGNKKVFDYFKPDSKRFNWTNAYLLALVSKLVYKGRGLRTRLRKLGLTRGYKFFYRSRSLHGDTQGFVASNDKVVIVAFRGTEFPLARDLLTDVRAAQVNKKGAYGGKVHKGFAKALQLVWKDVKGSVRRQGRSNRKWKKKIWLTGHSLGGALATLAAQRFVRRKIAPVQGVYTFGSPRVGNPAFKRAYRPRTYRFVNNTDVVPRFPPRGVLLKYRHVGRFKFFDRKGKYFDNPSTVKLVLKRFGSRVFSPKKLGMKEHGSANYTKRTFKYVGSKTKRKLVKAMAKALKDQLPPWMKTLGYGQ